MNETKGHDPLCHAYGFGPGQRMDICICTGIRIGRADERERLDFCCPPAERIEADLRERLAQEIEALSQSVTGPPGRRAAFLLAVSEAARIARGDS